MDEPTPSPTRAAAIRTAPARRISHALFVYLIAIGAVALPADVPGSAEPDRSAACCRLDVERADRSPVRAGTSPGSDRDVGDSRPDRVADFAGGIAARLHTSVGTPLVGEVFLLMASTGSTAHAHLYDRTPYTHDAGIHVDTVASHRVAADTVGTVTGTAVDRLDVTGAPGGGLSGGLVYAIAYLNELSDGAFTGDLRVAATGRLLPGGHLAAIDNVDAKTAAAHLANADVMFTSTVPSVETIDAHGARFVGEAVRDPGTGVTLNDKRRLDTFRRWGTSRPDGMDIVDARHLIDVASYLCGTGSSFACHVSEQLDDQAQQRFDQLDRSSNGAESTDRDPPLAGLARDAALARE